MRNLPDDIYENFFDDIVQLNETLNELRNGKDKKDMVETSIKGIEIVEAVRLK